MSLVGALHLPITLAAAQTAVSIGLGLSGLARPDGIGLDDAKTALGLIKDGRALRDHLGRTPDLEVRRLAKSFKSHADGLLATEFAADAADLAAHFDQVMPLCEFQDAFFAAENLDADRIAHVWLAAIHEGAPADLRPYFARSNGHTRHRDFFLGVTTPFLRALLSKRVTEPAMLLEVYRATLDGIDRLDRKADQAAARQSELLRRVDLLTAKIDQMAETQHAMEGGVSRMAILKLVEPIAKDVSDPQAALIELANAVQIAARVQDEGRHGSNLGDFVDEVLRRRANLSAQGAHREAISELDAALDREAAESTARTLRLLSAAVDEHLLDRDATGAAAKIARRVMLEAQGDPFDAVRAEYLVWLYRGRDQGLLLDLEVAVALARLARDCAVGTDQLGAALNNAGTALQLLGERRGDRALLHQSAEAFKAALQERTRDRTPLQWANTQNNLGTTLAKLGDLTAGTTKHEEAIEAFSNALKERTQDRVPLDWARTQDNLGIVLKNLARRNRDFATLRKAARAFDAALQERTQEKAPLDWASTQNNVGNTLLTAFELTDEVSCLEGAVDAFNAALQEWTRDEVPLRWAMAQNNLGNAWRVLGRRSRDIAMLRKSASAYDASLTVRKRDAMPIDWAMTHANLALLDVALFDMGEGDGLLDTAQAHLDAAAEAFGACAVDGYFDTIDGFQWAIDTRRATPS